MLRGYKSEYMNNLDLLNALLQLVFWTIEFVRLVLALLLVPFQILIALFTMHLPNAIEYSRFLAHARWNALKRFGLSFNLTVSGKKPQMEIRSYDDDAKEASVEFNKKSHTSLRACLADGLREAKKYLYVIFQNSGGGPTFIQLRVDAGVYLFDFPLTPRSLNRDYAIEVIDYLRSKGFEKTPAWTGYRYKRYFIAAEKDELTIIQANLGSNHNDALDICTHIFTRIFKSKAMPEVIFG